MSVLWMEIAALSSSVRQRCPPEPFPVEDAMNKLVMICGDTRRLQAVRRRADT
ncbi:MAG TPA: hypothetical protein VN043_12765 [Rhodanobacter sp.]|nr:hypothetical protein [Rhodanobacter sp.]